MGEALNKEVLKVAKDEAERSATVAVGKKMNITFGMLLTIIGLFTGFIIVNSSRVSRIEETVENFIENDKQTNAEFRQQIKDLAEGQKETSEEIYENDKTYLDKFDEIADNQSMLFWELNKLDPKFNPIVIRCSNRKSN